MLEEGIDRFRIPGQIYEDWSSISFDLIAQEIEPGDLVLDCGAGYGSTAIPLAKNKKCDVVAVDIDPERINELIKAAQGASVKAYTADVLKLPFDDGEFDVAYSRMLLTHFPNWKTVVREQLRCVRKGGKVIIHHGSLPQQKLAEKVVISRRLKAIKRRNAKRSCIVRSDIEKFARREKSNLDSFVPFGMFLPSNIIYRAAMPETERLQYEADLEEKIKSPEVRSFIDWYERSIVKYLSLEFSTHIIAVLRKL